MLTNEANENFQGLSFLPYLKWIVEIWKSINENEIKVSMKQCGVILKTGGLEDKLLHCFNVKRNEDGFRLLQQRRYEQTSCDLDISDKSVSEVCDSDESN